jgi:hypothetical protein
VNLVGLATHLPEVDSERRVRDVRERIELTLTLPPA